MFLPRIVNIRPRTVQGAPLATGRIPFPDHLQAGQCRSEIRVGLSHGSGKSLRQIAAIPQINGLNMLQAPRSSYNLRMQAQHPQHDPKVSSGRDGFHPKIRQNSSKFIKHPLPLAVGSSSCHRCSPGPFPHLRRPTGNADPECWHSRH